MVDNTLALHVNTGGPDLSKTYNTLAQVQLAQAHSKQAEASTQQQKLEIYGRIGNMIQSGASPSEVSAHARSLGLEVPTLMETKYANDPKAYKELGQHLTALGGNQQQPAYGPIGTDELGNPAYGWHNPRTQEVTQSGVVMGQPVGATRPGSASQPQTTGTSAAIASGATGNDFLKPLNPALASQIKGIAEGRLQPPTGFAASKPQGQAILRMVMQYDPTFDQANVGARFAQRKNYAGGGKQFQELQAIGTVAGHLHDLASTADKLNNFENLGPFNYPANKVVEGYRTKTQNPKLNDFNVTRQAVSNELAKAYRGGVVSEGEVKDWEQNVNAAQSPAQLKTVISRLNGLLMSKRQTLEEGYHNTMGKAPLPQEFRSTSERNRAVFNNIDEWSRGGKLKEKPSEAAAAQPEGTAAPKTRAEYDALSSGARYQHPDGSIRTKP